jgi:hypothetical protein
MGISKKETSEISIKKGGTTHAVVEKMLIGVIVWQKGWDDSTRLHQILQLRISTTFSLYLPVNSTTLKQRQNIPTPH